jgi:hypothetical protein
VKIAYAWIATIVVFVIVLVPWTLLAMLRSPFELWGKLWVELRAFTTVTVVLQRIKEQEQAQRTSGLN